MEIRPFPTKTTGEILNILSLTALVAVPPLAALAYRAWTKFQKKELPRWRNMLGLLSILIVVVNWVVFLTEGLAMSMRLHIPHSSFEFDNLFGALSVVSAGLCFSLKRAPRFQILAANVLMAILWAASVVE